MVTETSTRMYDTATSVYLGWLDASLNANERLARLARVWIDESVGAQQDLTQAMKQAMTETQTALTQGEESPTPMTFVSRAGDLARASYFHWTEAAFKAQERCTRIAQTTFEEMRGVQADLSSRTEERMGEMARAMNGR